MTGLMAALAVGLAGSLGAVARFVLDGVLRARYGSGFPWATLAVNVFGSALLGWVGGLVAGGWLAPTAGVVVGTGFCGGFTTFSTATVETLTLLRERRRAAAAAYAAGTLVACVGVAALFLEIAA